MQEAQNSQQQRAGGEVKFREYQFYGGAADFMAYEGSEAILDGPYDTGKTLAALYKLHVLLSTHPNSRALMVRKTRNSLIQSAVVTYEKKVLLQPPGHPACEVTKYGGERPEFYDYPNGSRLVCGGIDKPDKILSSEYDFVYVNQAEELTLDDWETLTGRATGRAGNAPFTQVFGDCNPGPPTHWILNRSRVKRFPQLHRHNPALYDQETGEVTEEGKQRLAVLQALTGIRRKRGLEGKWVAAEGQVYEGFDPNIHVIDSFQIPASWRRYRAVDFGYTNPFVCQWWAKDEDGRLYLYREIYMSKRTVKVHAEQIKRLSAGLTEEQWKHLDDDGKRRAIQAGEKFEATVADHDAEDRATLHENDVSTVAAIKDITRGIQAVEERLKVQGDGKPRLFIFRDALVEPDTELYRERPGDLHPCCTEQEFPVYVWAKSPDGKPNKEAPVDLYNHGQDALRYMVMQAEQSNSYEVLTW